MIRIFEELRCRGYEGSYDARRWNNRHGRSPAVAYVPLSFAAGEAYQFDWSHEFVVLNGVTATVKVARPAFLRVDPRM